MCTSTHSHPPSPRLPHHTLPHHTPLTTPPSPHLPHHTSLTTPSLTTPLSPHLLHHTSLTTPPSPHPPSPHPSPSQGMESPPLTEYKAERGLQEVLCKIDGTYRSLDDMATRLHRALAMVTSIHYFLTYSVHPSLSFLLSSPPPPSLLLLPSLPSLHSSSPPSPPSIPPPPPFPQNSTSWVVTNLAALYWRVVGQGPPAVQCLKNALHYGPDNMRVCGCGHPWKLL